VLTVTSGVFNLLHNVINAVYYHLLWNIGF